MNKQFESARAKVVYSQKEYAGFGTLGEKSIHSVIKHYLEPDTDFHEVGIMGNIADICRENKIYEVQTHALYRLKNKLIKFLKFYDVCVVYPIIAEKTIYTLDHENFTVTKKRKSPRKQTIYHFLPQVYGLSQLLGNKNLSFKIIVLTASEYRLSGSGKSAKRGEKFDTVPDDFLCEINLYSASDFSKLIPADLPDKFTSSDFAKCAGLKPRDASVSLNILAKCGNVEKIDKKARSFVYRIIE